ncbi:hypothetical protein LG045_03145 [Limosilactobacillus gastricus]|nr:hypothetical protein LG045_03145 [Limosilactobacillus gastricus]
MLYLRFKIKNAWDNYWELKMEFKLVNLKQVKDYQDWLYQLGHLMTKEPDLQNELIQQLVGREQVGSTIIDPGIIMPHIINENLFDHVVIVSHLQTPLKLADQNVTTAVILLMRTIDTQIDSFMKALISDDHLQQLKEPTIQLVQIKAMFRQE